jgi:hypothetical protein
VTSELQRRQHGSGCNVAKEMEKMHNEDPKRWGKEMKPKWDAAPEA